MGVNPPMEEWGRHIGVVDQGGGEPVLEVLEVPGADRVQA